LLGTPLPDETIAIQQRSYVTYSFPSVSGDATVTLLESRSVIASGGTTGLRTWEAAMHLASFLLSSQGRVFAEGKRVLELGAGTGLASIVCGKHLNPTVVYATDGNQEVVESIEDGIFLNDVKNVHPRLLKWGTVLDPGENDEHRVFDTVIGADIVSTCSTVWVIADISRLLIQLFSLHYYLRFESFSISTLALEF
jgi:protein-lysine N-methyltransferase EEF2KMT